jgi:hypothetical protein
MMKNFGFTSSVKSSTLKSMLQDEFPGKIGPGSVSEEVGKHQRSASDDRCDDPSLVALASVLKSYMSGIRTPFQVKLSVTMHGLTRSREIVDLLKRFSFGISYKDVLHLYDAWAEHDITANNICPAELTQNIPSAAIMDNDEFADDTFTGANTSHRTNVMFVQPESAINLPPQPFRSQALQRSSNCA